MHSVVLVRWEDREAKEKAFSCEKSMRWNDTENMDICGLALFRQNKKYKNNEK